MIEKTDRDLLDEVCKIMDRATSQGHVPLADMLVQEVMSGWDEIPESIQGWEWWTLCGYGHTRSVVRKATQARKASLDDNIQLLPGFEHLQTFYSVSRNRKQCIVRLDLMTDDEIDAKCLEYETMSAGCLAHSKELRRYKDERRAAPSIPDLI